MKFLKSTKIKKNFFLIITFVALFISTFNIISNFFEKVILDERQIFADFTVYRCGAITFLNNVNPYKPNALSECFNTSGTALDFFYPPFTLKIFSIFSYIELHNSLFLWGIIILPIFFYQIFLIHKTFFKKEKIILFLIVYLFSFGGLNFTGLLTGNITILMYSLLGISFYYSITKKNTALIFLVLTFMCLFKITYLVFFILVFFINKKNFFTNAFFSLFTIIFFYFLSYLNNTKIFLDFLNHLTYLRSYEFFELYGGGFGLYSIIKEIPEIFSSGISVNYKYSFQFIWFLICGLFMLSIFYLVIKNKQLSKTHILAICILIITICYPLLKDYEGFLLVSSIYYLILNINWNAICKKNTEKFKYTLLFLTFAIHDKYMLFVTAMFIFFSILYLDYKKKKIFINK